MPVVVHVPAPSEDHTWSITPVRVPVPGEGHMVAHPFGVPILSEENMVAHARWCSCSSSQRGPFEFLVRTTHGRSRSLVFHSPVRIAHGQPLLNLLWFSLSPHRYTTLPKRRP